MLVHRRIWVAVAACVLLVGCEEEAPPANEGGGGGGIGGEGGAGSGGAPMGGAGGEGGTVIDFSRLAGSGTRLKVRGLQAGDVVAPRELFDTELGHPCSAMQTEDGVLRCVPGQAQLVYADAACTMPVARTSSFDCDSPPYANEWSERGAEVHEVTEEIVNLSTVYFAQEGGCLESSSPPAAYRVAGPALEPSRFVAMEQVEVPRGDRLEVRYYVAEDGAYIAGRATDRELDARCQVAPLPGGVDACIPDLEGQIAWNSFAEPDCTGAVLQGHNANPRFFWDADVVDGCAGDIHVYEFGELLPVTYSNGSSACEMVDNGHDYRLGPEIAPALLAEVTFELLGTGRIRLRESRAGDGPIATEYGMLDTMLDALCTPTRFDDGSYRCVPQAYEVRLDYGPFGDAACTQPLARACLAASYFVARVAESCWEDAEAVFAPGAPFTGATLYYRSGASCNGHAASGSWVHMGAAAPSTTFPELPRVVVD
jgi:hypothetical protein